MIWLCALIKTLKNVFDGFCSFFQLQPPGVICSITWEHHKQLQLCRCFAIYPVHLHCLSLHLSDLNMVVFQLTLTDMFLSCSFKTNYILIIFSVIFLALYVVVLVICRKADVSIQKTTGSFLLPENNPSDRFLYAVTVDTGLRSRTRMTAKVVKSLSEIISTYMNPCIRY